MQETATHKDHYLTQKINITLMDEMSKNSQLQTNFQKAPSRRENGRKKNQPPG